MFVTLVSRHLDYMINRLIKETAQRMKIREHITVKKILSKKPVCLL